MAYSKNQRANFTYWIDKAGRFDRHDEFMMNKINKKPTDKQIKLYTYLKEKCEEVGIIPKALDTESYVQTGKAVSWMKEELKKASGFIYSNSDFESWLNKINA